MAFQDLLDQYFFQPDDQGLDEAPFTLDGCLVTPLIDATAYNAAVKQALDQVGNEADNADHFVFITNWWLGLVEGNVTQEMFLGPNVKVTAPYYIDPVAKTKLIDVLKEKADNGVDVRVMAWVNDALMSADTVRMVADAGITDVLSINMQSIANLRKIASIGSNAIMNITSHSGGGVHMKMVIIGNDTQHWGFTGGIDFEMSRYATPDHIENTTWHDVAVQVEGPVVQALYDHYQFAYNENVRRSASKFKFEGKKIASRMPDTSKIKDRATPPIGGGSHHVQSLRTIPKCFYKKPNCVKEIPGPPAFPNGLFEYRSALKKAIGNADRFIYVEDQLFWSQEIMSWINDRIKLVPILNVIILTSGAVDPNDPDYDQNQIWTHVINNGLLAGLNASQRGQVCMYKRWSPAFGQPSTEIVHAILNNDSDNLDLELERETNGGREEDYLVDYNLNIEFDGENFTVIGNVKMEKGDKVNLKLEKPHSGVSVPSVGDEVKLFRMGGITIHAKTVIIDDNWALIGSANQMRRSLYTDWEHSISFMDEDDILVREYRCDLWSDHFVHNNPLDFSDIESALHSWNPDWGVGGGNAPGLPVRPRLNIDPPILEWVPLPWTPNSPWDPGVKQKYDVLDNPDSRVRWNGTD